MDGDGADGLAGFARRGANISDLAFLPLGKL